jgi:hypothetical protein
VRGRITFLTAMLIISFLIQDAHFDAVRRSSREAHSVLLIARMIARGYSYRSVAKNFLYQLTHAAELSPFLVVESTMVCLG